jgi:nucleolar protein 58
MCRHVPPPARWLRARLRAAWPSDAAIGRASGAAGRLCARRDALLRLSGRSGASRPLHACRPRGPRVGCTSALSAAALALESAFRRRGRHGLAALRPSACACARVRCRRACVDARSPRGGSAAQSLEKAFSSIDGARKVVKLKAFKKFDNTADALAAAAALVDSKLPKSLKKFLTKHGADDTLALADAKLGGLIKEKLSIPCVHSAQVMELMRGVRYQLGELLGGLETTDLAPMSLGLSHSLSRYKLKFSPDKVDTMVVQAIGLLDDLDKELNTYAMRVREWYGWHFPEMTKVVNDNIAYARVIRIMGDRVNAAGIDFSEVLDEETEAELKAAAQVSMGTEMSEADQAHIDSLAEQVIALAEYRAQLYDYLKARMAAIAPNLTVLVGELVGARLIAHAGSLVSLAKHPASTVQILGAEKALFRALKTKHDTPKYGLIYHASLVGAAPPKLKGKISRVLAAKCALSIRVDALGEGSEATIGLDDREKARGTRRRRDLRERRRVSLGSRFRSVRRHCRA